MVAGTRTDLYSVRCTRQDSQKHGVSRYVSRWTYLLSLCDGRTLACEDEPLCEYHLHIRLPTLLALFVFLYVVPCGMRRCNGAKVSYQKEAEAARAIRQKG